MTAFRRLIAAATLLTAATFAPGLAAADDRHEDARRDDRAFTRDDDRTSGPHDGRRDDRRDDRLATPAAAHVHDRSCGHEPRLQPPAPAPAPAWATRDDLRWDGRRWVQAGWDRHEGRQRFVQAQALRLELRALDRERAAFHARFAFQPRRLARHDAGYFEQRASLERRLQQLTWYAWR